MTRKNKGFTLLELMIAITVLSVGIVGVFGLIQNTLRSAEDLKSRLIASYLAQEGIELVRNIRDNNWAQGNDWMDNLSCSVSGCEVFYNQSVLQPHSNNNLFISSEGFYGSVGTETKYRRVIFVNTSGEARAEVSWDGNTVKVIENLRDWY
jgi:prepilin-type N-terminal cleavage/methylation domain-containing protein